MFYWRPVLGPRLILAALALASSRETGSHQQQQQQQQQLADGQAASTIGQNGPDWGPSEDSWNYWWSYSGISGPAYWGLLNLDWHMCDKGRRQSPINIETNKLVYDPHLSPLQLDTNLISGILHNDGHAIVFNASARRPKLSLLGGGGGGQKQQSNAETSIKSMDTTTTTKTNRRRRRDLHHSDNRLIGLASIDFLPLNTRDLSQKVNLSISQSEAIEAKFDLSLVDQLPGDRELSAVSAADDAAAYDDSGGGSGGPNADDDGSANNRVQISGAGLSYSYSFEAIYFRFGLDNKQAGSEHLIDSQWHQAELQILAYNSHLYGSFHEASNRAHGLLAISILVDVLEQTNDGGTNKQSAAANKQLEKLLAPLNEIRYRNQMAEVREFNLSALLPDRSQFVTYEGSLNVPGCHESVDWLLLNRPLYMGQPSLDLLRSMSADEQKADTLSGTLIGANLRPTQPVNGRPIRTNIIPVNNQNQPAACQRLWTRYDYRPNR